MNVNKTMVNVVILKYLRVGLCICCLMAMKAFADEIVHGEKGNWNPRWVVIGVNDTAKLSNAGFAVAQALDAAKHGNASFFYSLCGVDSNSPPALEKSRYDELETNIQQYVYVIEQEALMDGGKATSSSEYSAISVVPVMSREKSHKGMMTNEPQLQAQVFFAKKMAGSWRLLPDIFDKQIEQYLLKQASTILYQPKKSFTPEGILEQEKKFQSDSLDTMRQNGASQERISSQKEVYEVDNTHTQIKHWADWTNYFKANILNPPIKFDQCDAYNYNYGDPVSAFRSYMYASTTGDANALIKYADTSQLQYLKRMGVDPSVKAGSYEITNAMTCQIVLMTATTFFDGKDYALVLFRSQNKSDPRNGSIGLHVMIFVRNQDVYLATRDLYDSYFGGILFAAHASGRMIWKYSDFIKTMKQSEFPASFYVVP